MDDASIQAAAAPSARMRSASRRACTAGLLLLGALLAACGSLPSQRQAAAIVIDGATLVDPLRGERRADMRVVTEGDRIGCVGRRDECAVPAGARHVDGSGRFLIPGLFDAHVHTSQRLRQVAPLYLAFGITSVRDVGGFPDFTRALQDDIRSGALLGPRIYTAGRPIDGHPSMWPIAGIARSVRTPDEARAAVRDTLAEGADFIKLYNALSPELVRAAADEARAHGARVTIDYLLRGPDIVDAVDGVEHVVPPLAVGSDPVQRYAASDAAARTVPILRRMQQRGTTLTSTMVLMERVAAGGLAEREPTYAALPAALRARSAEMLGGINALAAAFMRATRGTACEQLRAFAAMGGVILAGTDSYFVTSYPGDLHRELELLVECGLTPAQALAAGSINPARWLGLRDVGVVAPGARADLLLLRADPLLDIAATRSIEWIVKDGRVHTPAEVLRTIR